MVTHRPHRTLFAAVLTFAATAGFAAPADTASLSASDEARVADARERRSGHYADRLALFLAEAPMIEPGGVVFVGDSITEGFPLADAFKGENVINRGIGGDVVDGVIERLDVSVGALHPSKVYLMIGINNLSWATPDIPLEDFLARYEILFEGLRREAPDASIYIQSILPGRSGSWSAANSRVLDVNEGLREMAEEFGCHWVNLHPHFCDDEGLLREEFAADGVHLTISGYLQWLSVGFSDQDDVQFILNLAPRWLIANNPRRHVDKIDPPAEGDFPGSRGRNELVVYTPAYERGATGTNEFGREATVRRGVVTALGVNDSPIPADGFVVSGHLDSAVWIVTNLTPGKRVELDGDEIRVALPPVERMSPQERLRQIKVQTLERLTESEDEQVQSQGRTILQGILRLERRDSSPGTNELRALESLLTAISARE